MNRVLYRQNVDDRSARLRSGIFTSVIARAVVAAVPLATLPVTVKVLGVTGYGIWAAVNSVTALLVFSDFGLGTGLMTRLANSPGTAARKVVIASALTMASLLCAVLLAVVLVAGWLVDWSALLDVTAAPIDLNWTVVAVFSATVLNIVAALINRIQFGLDHVTLANAWTAAGAVVTAACMYAAAALGVNRGVFIAVICFTPLLVAAANWFVFFVTTGRRFKPSFADADWGVARSLMGLGLKFMTVSLLMALSAGLDVFLVARVAGVEAAAQFAVPVRILGAVAMLTGMVSAPLWPANAQAFAAGEAGWIRATRRRTTTLLGLVVGGAVLALCLIGPAFVDLWLGGQVAVAASLFAAIGLWTWVQAVIAPTFMVQNGAEVIRPQLVGYIVFLVAIPLKIYAGSHFGSTAIPLVGTVCYVMIVWPAAFLGYRLSMAKLKAA